MDFSRVPVEVWDIILGHLDVRTIKSLRLTNRQRLHDLAINSCWGRSVERLSLSTDRVKIRIKSVLHSYNNVDDEEPCYMKFSIPVDDEHVMPQSDHVLEANHDAWSPWHALGLSMGEQEQLEVNKSFFDTLVEIFRALVKVKEIRFWQDRCRGRLDWGDRKIFKGYRPFCETARLYFLTVAAILESNIVLDSFQPHFLCEWDLALIVAAPFYSRAIPYSMAGVNALIRSVTLHEFTFHDFLKGYLPPKFSSQTGLPDPGEPIPPKLKPGASNIRCLQANIHPNAWRCLSPRVFEEWMQFLNVEQLTLRNAKITEGEILRILCANPDSRVRHVEISKIDISDPDGRPTSWKIVLEHFTKFVPSQYMPSLESLTLGHLKNGRLSIPLVLVGEDPRDFRKLTRNPDAPSFRRTFSRAELAKGIEFRGPARYNGYTGQWAY